MSLLRPNSHFSPSKLPRSLIPSQNSHGRIRMQPRGKNPKYEGFIVNIFHREITSTRISADVCTPIPHKCWLPCLMPWHHRPKEIYCKHHNQFRLLFGLQGRNHIQLSFTLPPAGRLQCLPPSSHRHKNLPSFQFFTLFCGKSFAVTDKNVNFAAAHCNIHKINDYEKTTDTLWLASPFSSSHIRTVPPTDRRGKASHRLA